MDADGTNTWRSAHTHPHDQTRGSKEQSTQTVARSKTGHIAKQSSRSRARRIVAWMTKGAQIAFAVSTPVDNNRQKTQYHQKNRSERCTKLSGIRQKQAGCTKGKNANEYTNNGNQRRGASTKDEQAGAGAAGARTGEEQQQGYECGITADCRNNDKQRSRDRAHVGVVAQLLDQPHLVHVRVAAF